MAKQSLPQEMILQICKELGAEGDFATLRNCALVSRRVSTIALEELYGNINLADPFVEGKSQTAKQWRAVVLSSFGATAYPYCAYLRVLPLGRLADFLDSLRHHRHLSKAFFDGVMQEHLKKSPNVLQNVEICGESITKYIKEVADNTGTAPSLTRLEIGAHIPESSLETWLSRLRTLTSLKVEDASILRQRIGMAITTYCPRFNELIIGDEFTCAVVATDMAEFFYSIPRNSLQTFEVNDALHFTTVTYDALSYHAESLKTLKIRRLVVRRFPKHPLFKLTALECLVIEKPRYEDPHDVVREVPPSEVGQWIGNCKALRELRLIHFNEAIDVLKEVLEAPGIQLEILSIHNFRQPRIPERAREAWTALGGQERLKSLTIARLNDNACIFPVAAESGLVASICRLTTLTSLDLSQTWVSPELVEEFSNHLPNLQEFLFHGDLFEEADVEPVLQLPLKLISATFFLSYISLRRFVMKLTRERHQGIRIEYYSHVDMAAKSIDAINRLLKSRVGGQLSVVRESLGHW
ncbi:hypothetical protein GGR50DRAFT_694472 [Xylaria sp. CBS 124048]|nr:hypothetical protein GGR50DRAFT_694472 [Xylaria sp. CBS 124048]